MLTVCSEIQVSRFNKKTVETLIGTTLDCPFYYMSHPVLVEFEAEMRGEKTSAILIGEAIYQFNTGITHAAHRRDVLFASKEKGITPLLALDGSCTVPYTKETLSRHFLYFQHMIAEYPHEEIPVPFTIHDIQDLLHIFFLEDSNAPLTRVLHSLQTLTPISDLYYFLYRLDGLAPGTITSLLSGITEKERANQRRVHTARLMGDENEGSVQHTLPLDGEGAGILATFCYGGHHLATEQGPLLLPDCPSWLFVHAMESPDAEAVDLASALVQRGFNDHTEHLSSAGRKHVIECLLRFLENTNRDDPGVPLAYAMLGFPLQHPGGMLPYAPYQVEVDTLYLKQTMNGRLYHIFATHGLFTQRQIAIVLNPHS